MILGFAADECSTDSTWIADDACVSRIGGRPVFTVAPLPQPTCLICNGPLIQLLQVFIRVYYHLNDHDFVHIVVRS